MKLVMPRGVADFSRNMTRRFHECGTSFAYRRVTWKEHIARNLCWVGDFTFHKAFAPRQGGINDVEITRTDRPIHHENDWDTNSRFDAYRRVSATSIHES
jgi:hypothetical protein